ncbi:putative hAT family C-terminal dimerization region-containing protein 6 [Homarus americanus]|uniref:Putative hAT family C-terminal dimerization region-containing protein 6 n=1 Tax=Homarus americanus TaxID=6706 RepID=A0A8J5N1U9_HOMAM|nr:putative hAT family C-terminal dimerization region-containing protein 6 [Homarus americanus]
MSRDLTLGNMELGVWERVVVSRGGSNTIKEKISKIVDLIIAESTKDYKEKVQKEEIQENELSMSINQDKDGIIAKRPRLFAYMPPPGPSMASPSTVVKTELETYLEEGVLPFDINPLKYWRDIQSFKILRHFAKSILGCCATSAPSERVFSKACNFYTPERAKLSPEIFRALMMIKCNSDL